jgi:hypothetical protein
MPEKPAMFGIAEPGIRIAVWVLCCVVSAICTLVFWPLGTLPFGMLLLFSLANAHGGRKPWG